MKIPFPAADDVPERIDTLMATTFYGLATVGKREYEIDVRGTPPGRIVIVVNRKKVFDKKPFIPRDRIEFQIEGRSAVLEWRTVGFMRQDCYVTLGTQEFLLDERDSTGHTVTEERKSELSMIAGGVTAIVVGLILVILNYYDVREGNYSHTDYLVMAPALLVGGVAVLILKRKMTGGAGLPGDARLYVAGVVVALLVGWGFSAWFVGSFGE